MNIGIAEIIALGTFTLGDRAGRVGRNRSTRRQRTVSENGPGQYWLRVVICA